MDIPNASRNIRRPRLTDMFIASSAASVPYGKPFHHASEEMTKMCLLHLLRYGCSGRDDPQIQLVHTRRARLNYFHSVVEVFGIRCHDIEAALIILHI